MEPYLNIVALNVPYPANYGGVIDIYYKLEHLHKQGVKIILHCFEYNRPRAAELEKFCTEVNYYKRKTGWKAVASVLPYNVYGRKNRRLLKNLAANPYPILFEGLHTCWYLNRPELKNRIKIYRESNIEHRYYKQLAQAEPVWWKKLFLYTEAFKFKLFEKRLSHADLMLCVNREDTDYLQKKFPGKRVELMRSFHPDNEITAHPGRGKFILYHGNLSVSENEKAALFLINEVFAHLPYPCVVAGLNPSPRLLKQAEKFKNVAVEANVSPERMEALQRNAHINLLVTFQPTGLKLKLLNSLFAGRFTVVNTPMLAGTDLSPLCRTADSAQQIAGVCRRLMECDFTEQDAQMRRGVLVPEYSNTHQAERLKRILYTFAG